MRKLEKNNYKLGPLIDTICEIGIQYLASGLELEGIAREDELVWLGPGVVTILVTNTSEQIIVHQMTL